MANSKQSRKRARQAEKRRQHNAPLLSRARTYIKKVLQAVESGNQAEANAVYSVCVSYLDKLAKVNLIHKNRAARLKSRLNARIKAIAA